MTGTRRRPPRPRRSRVPVLPQLISAAVEARPEATAIVFAEATRSPRSLTYAELDEHSTRLARVLLARGIGPGDLVALGIPRSIESVTAVWAVAKTGAGFVPIDPDHPAERIEHMLTDSGAVLGLTVAEVAEKLAAGQDSAGRDSAGRDSAGREWLVLDGQRCADDLAAQSTVLITNEDRVRPLRAAHAVYVIYTSGSTGTPKGVVITHAALAAIRDEQATRYGIGVDSRVLHVASPSFDVSVFEMLMMLAGPATLVVAAPTVYGGAELAGLVRRERVTHLIGTPSMLSSVDPAGLDDLRTVLAAGEACPPDLVRRWAVDLADGRPRRFVNAYGPTEATIITHSKEGLTADQPVTIGSTLVAAGEYVLDQRLSPLPVGAVGELYLCGTQLAQGYLGRPGMTSTRFVADPFAESGARLYRTGDLVRRTKDGELEYLGRNDFQVKIRGVRIELGEVEAALSAQPGVATSVVLVKSDQHTGDRLVGYVVPADPAAAPEPAAVAAGVAERLPAHLVPSAFVVLDELPLTVNGKLNRQALPDPVTEPRVYRAPCTPIEQTVAAVFAEVLGMDRVGVDDNFFELGGNSLAATRVAARLGAEWGTPVAAMALFAAPTPETLTRQMFEQWSGSGAGANSALDVLLPLRPGTREPLFCIHPLGGIAWSFAGLSAHLETDRPIYGLQTPALNSRETLPESTEQWAQRYLDEIRSVQPRGPYHLLGWSLGGVLAHAIAVRLQTEGERVELLAMMDSYLPAQTSRTPAEPVAAAELLTGVLGELAAEIDLGEDDLPEDLAEQLSRLPEPFASVGADRIARVLDAATHSVEVTRSYRPDPFQGDLVYFTAIVDDPTGRAGADTWVDAVAGRIHTHPVPTTHWRMTTDDALAEIGPVLDRLGADAEAPAV